MHLAPTAISRDGTVNELREIAARGSIQKPYRGECLSRLVAKGAPLINFITMAKNTPTKRRSAWVGDELAGFG